MEQIVFILDESGAKGYSDKRESMPGELGVIAGYLVPRSYLERVKSDLDSIRLQYFGNGKIHITDLQPEQQESLRNSIFKYFKQSNVYWVYEATYVQGFCENAILIEEISRKSKDEKRSNVKISGNKNPDMLHVELFQGAFGKAVAFCMDRGFSNFELEIITDKTDKEILEKFKRAADELLNVGQEKCHLVTGFDPETKQVVKGSITTTITDGHEELGDFSGVSYSIRCEDSSLTLAADVLSNSVNYHLKSHQVNNIGMLLNKSTAISGHPLDSLVYGTWDDSESNYFPDAAFMHPEQKKNYMKGTEE